MQDKERRGLNLGTKLSSVQRRVDEEVEMVLSRYLVPEIRLGRDIAIRSTQQVRSPGVLRQCRAPSLECQSGSVRW